MVFVFESYNPSSYISSRVTTLLELITGYTVSQVTILWELHIFGKTVVGKNCSFSDLKKQSHIHYVIPKFSCSQNKQAETFLLQIISAILK